jgi:methionyl-tRNA synthetase
VGVEEIIRRIDAAGDLYTASHEGWYCAPCEAFYPEKDLVEGKCPVHGTTLELQKEENVFFRLSRYGGRLLELYQEKGLDGQPFVYPESRLNEVRSFVESGLKDLSVSRTSIKWGIPFPGRPGHVVYVWLDALVNYITALGFGSRDLSLYERYWPGIHVIGKDILRFHAVYWPAFLMSAGLPIPRQVVSHGWWLRDAKKMSKSTGNVVRPDDLVAAFGVDALRWHLVSAMSFGQDANFSDEDFLAGYNADLANGLGNALSRAVKMSRDAFGGKTPGEMCDDNEVRAAATDAVAAWRSAFESYRLQDAAAAVRTLVTRIDGYIAAKEPWKKVKAEGVTPALHRIQYATLEGLRVAACMLAPIAPRTATEVFRPPDLAWGQLPLNASLPAAPPLFPRADAKEYFASRGESASGASKERSVTDDKENISLAPTSAVPVPSESKIAISDFLKLDLRVGEVIAAEKVEKSRKLMKMTVKLGEEVRTIVGGIATAYTAEQLVGRKLVFVANLQPAKLMGIESDGMVLAATLPDTGEASLLAVDPSVPSGAKVK